MTTFRQVDVICPCCASEFQALELTSTNNFGGQYTDFHQIAVGTPPIPLLMNACPTCAFSGYVSAFQGKDVSAEVKHKVRDELTPHAQEVQQDGGRRYEFAARIASWQNEPPNRLADYYLRAAWCCVDERNSQHEMEYRRQAIHYFQTALEDHQYASDAEPGINYLIGELYRRVGEIEKAREWFNIVITWAKADPAWEKMAANALAQRDDPKEKFERR